MWKPCLICSVYHLEMVNIYRHPGKLAYILKFLLGLQAKQDDYLCKVCCDQVINAFESKQKFNKSKLHETKVLSDGGKGAPVEHDLVGKIEISSSKSNQDMEPKSDDELLVEDYSETFTVDDQNMIKIFGKWLSDNNLQLKEELEEETSSTDGLEVQNDVRGTANENLFASQREAACSKVSEERHEPNRGVEGNFNVARLHVGSVQSNNEHNTEGRRKYYKREKSVDIDDNKDEEETLGGRGTKEVDVVREDIQCHSCNEICCSIISYEVHMTEEHPSRKKRLDSPIKEKPVLQSFSRKYNLRKRNSVKDDPKKHDSVKDDPRKHDPRKDDPRKDDNNRKDDPKRHDPVKVDPRKHDPRKGDPKKDDPRKDDIRKDDRKKYGLRKHDPRKDGTTKNGNKKRIRYYPGKPYKCCHCSKTFRDKYHQKRHIRTHLRKPHKCSNCGLCFATESLLKSHKITHTARRSCSHCSMAFRCRFELSNHLQTHIQEAKKKARKRVCPECGKVFSNLTGLRSHIRTHTRPFICKECGMNFSKVTNLKTHQMEHTGERPYKCSHCSKAFKTNYNLWRHVQQHTEKVPCKCSQCSKHFDDRRLLVVHQLHSHTDKRPYECPYCPKFFKSKSGIFEHLGKHMRELGDELLSEDLGVKSQARKKVNQRKVKRK